MRDQSGLLVWDDWRQFWNTNQKYLILFLLALAVDTLSTIHFMAFSGPDQEFHPLIRMAAFAYGPVAGPILAATYKLLAALIVVLYWNNLTAAILTTAAVLCLFAGFYNYFAAELYLRGFIPWLPI